MHRQSIPIIRRRKVGSGGVVSQGAGGTRVARGCVRSLFYSEPPAAGRAPMSVCGPGESNAVEDVTFVPVRRRLLYIGHSAQPNSRVSSGRVMHHVSSTLPPPAAFSPNFRIFILFLLHTPIYIYTFPLVLHSRFARFPP